MRRNTISVKEAAAYIGISKDLVYQLIRESKLPHLRLGRRILFRKDALDLWMHHKEKSSLKSEEYKGSASLHEFIKPGNLEGLDDER